MKTKISSKLLKVIRDNQTFLIAGHVNPEGDSVGSSLALAEGLRKMGKTVTVLSKDPVPEILGFLPRAAQIRQNAPGKKVDVLIIVDCNTPERTGFDNLKAEKTIVIDHHIQSGDGSDAAFYRSLSGSFIDPEAAATGVLIYKLLLKLGIEMDRNIATNLYTAILVDTGGFRYSNVEPESLGIAARLVQAGARPWGIAKEVYESIPFKSMRLLGLSLTTLERKDGIAWMTATKEMFRKTETTAEDSEDFVDFPRKVRGAEVAVFFRQDGPRLYKVSLRSKGRVNVQTIARKFGGGGHAAASGCRIKGTFKEVQQQLFRAVRGAIRK